MTFSFIMILFYLMHFDKILKFETFEIIVFIPIYLILANINFMSKWYTAIIDYHIEFPKNVVPKNSWCT